MSGPDLLNLEEPDLLNVDGGPTTAGVRYGFFTDTSICIGCKACEVACKEWNHVPDNPRGFTGESLDNTGSLGSNAWRHVAFVEQDQVAGDSPPPVMGLEWFGEDPGLPDGAHGSEEGRGVPLFGEAEAADPSKHGFRWLMSSDVCKHCTHAACLEVCPTGAIFYTEFDSVVVQDDICNGCGYCVTACPYGVIERRESDGGAWKCTLCYDRLRGGKQPACSQACPTDSIQFGPLEQLRERAAARVDALVDDGYSRAQLYGHDQSDGVGGNGAFFLLLDDPEVYRLPPDPVTPTRKVGRMWRSATLAGVALAATVATSFLGTSRRLP